ncbi:MAG TPA: IS66 family insertion sequence element accessory protein TnpB [Bacillota bacterium]|nr:IS66 family insertion sequence element accessory protein TnpB [Bacillota bacterium]
MLNIKDDTPVFLACGHTDMRKSINGLAAIVENSFACR